MNVKDIREKYPEGTVIELEYMAGEPQMPEGLRGRVDHVDDSGQIHVRWDNGSSLALHEDEDSFRKVNVQEKLTVLYIEVDNYPKTLEIDNNLKAMQNLVDGYIQSFFPFDDNVAVIVNDEGKINGSLLNRSIKENNKIIEFIAGNFFVCGFDQETNEFTSLTPEQIDKYAKKLKYPEIFFRAGGQIQAIAKPVKRQSFEEMVYNAKKTSEQNKANPDKKHIKKEDYEK